MGQTIINIMFLIILICHIIKINYLQKENNRLWQMVGELSNQNSRHAKIMANLSDDIDSLLSIQGDTVYVCKNIMKRTGIIKK